MVKHTYVQLHLRAQGYIVGTRAFQLQGVLLLDHPQVFPLSLVSPDPTGHSLSVSTLSYVCLASSLAGVTPFLN